jgi:hypothetical protein
LNGLTQDLFLHWDTTYSTEKFPPASKFFGLIDKAKNRHIRHDQIHKVPQIQQLVLAVEEAVDEDITVDTSEEPN